MLAVMNQCVLALIATLMLSLSRELLADLSAQGHCDPSLPQRTDTPLGYRDRGNRCEGIYVKQVGSTMLLVASFTESFADYTLEAGKPLQLEWDLPPGQSPVRLRAQGLKRRLYYRMDTSQPPGNKSYSWAVNVLASLNIRKPDIGVVGLTRYRVGQTEREVYLPLRISQAGRPIRTGRYTLILLPGVELAEVFVSLAPTGADGQPGKFIRDGEKLGYGYYPAERGVAIPLSGLPQAGIYYLEIGAALSSGGTTTVQLWFYHPNG